MKRATPAWAECATRYLLGVERLFWADGIAVELPASTNEAPADTRPEGTPTEQEKVSVQASVWQEAAPAPLPEPLPAASLVQTTASSLSPTDPLLQAAQFLGNQETSILITPVRPDEVSAGETSSKKQEIDQVFTEWE